MQILLDAIMYGMAFLILGYAGALVAVGLWFLAKPAGDPDDESEGL